MGEHCQTRAMTAIHAGARYTGGANDLTARSIVISTPPSAVQGAAYPATNSATERTRRYLKLRNRMWQIGAIRTGDIIATNISSQLAAMGGNGATPEVIAGQ